MNDFFRIKKYDCVDSTNELVKTMAKKGEKEGFVAVADRQNLGRGRLGRAFFSPEGGVYMSVLLRPRIAPEKAVSITTMAAVAVCEAIEDYTGKKTGIKWVNDIVVDGGKVCGILTEAAASNGDFLDYAVLGIGVNVVSPKEGYPNDIKGKAKALFEGECPLDAREKIISGILSRLYRYYADIDKALYVESYRRRSVVIGRVVGVIKNGRECRKALVTGINDDCALEVKYDDGISDVLNTGEVSINYEYKP